jgi:hypothetical protein
MRALVLLTIANQLYSESTTADNVKVELHGAATGDASARPTGAKA